MEEIKQNQKSQGVHPKSIYAITPRQERFIDLYFDVKSPTFGNCYQSAKSAGYSTETARNLTHNRPKWLSEKLGKMQTMEPQLLLMKLTDVINSPNESTYNKLKAIDMMMRHYKMFGQSNVFATQINIQSVLD